MCLGQKTGAPADGEPILRTGLHFSYRLYLAAGCAAADAVFLVFGTLISDPAVAALHPCVRRNMDKGGAYA
jgi:hypothetical protein